MGILLPRVKYSTILSIIFILRFGFISSFSCSTNWGKIQFGKVYGSYAWVPIINSKFAQFTILPKSNSIYPFLEHPIEDESELQKHLEVFCEKLQRFQNMLDLSSQPNFQESYSSFPVSPIKTTINTGLEYGTLAWVRAAIAKSDGLTISPQFPKSTSILTFSRRTNCKEYGRHDSESKFYYTAYQ